MRRALVLLTAFATMLLAQGGPPPGGPGPGPGPGMDAPRRPHFRALQEALNISPEEVRDLVQFVREQRREMGETLKAEGIREKMRTNLQALRELLESENPDPAEVGRLVVELRNLRERVREVRAAFHEAVRNYVKNTLNRGRELEALEEAAKLIPAIHQAGALGLLGPMGPPEGGEGPGALRHGKRGRRGFGFGGFGSEAPPKF